MAAGLAARIAGGFGALIDLQRGALFPWVPVWLGAGIGLYFLAPAEPLPRDLALAAGLALVLFGLGWRWRRARAGPLVLIPALLLCGFALMGIRAQLVAAPVLGFRYYGPVEGRITEVDRSASGAVRLTLAEVVLARMAPGRTPAQVRISIQGAQDFIDPVPGMLIITTASLGPPEGPVIPGGFDFRRLAWFRQLGAVGYTASPVLMLEPAGHAQPIARLRHRMAEGIRADLPGQPGAFAAAILTGDYSGISGQTMEELRVSSLVHMISISGLHMVLLCGAVFWGLRLALALVPGAALRWPIRRIAALGALAMGAFYYLLSGGAIPAERAWVMIAVVFVAVLIDRQAISLRSLAVAGVVVLILRPESLIDAGFQMSFAATLALVSVLGEIMARLSFLPRWAANITSAVLASALAGAASAPFAAAHFNRYADYGLIANLLAGPVMGLAVMPLCVLWMLALPFGLTAPVLWLMGQAIGLILWIGAVITALPGAVTMVASPGALVLPMISFGGLILALWRGPLRAGGAALILAGMVLWAQSSRPELLISSTGGLVGLMTPDGRALSKPSGERFAASRWLEDDGDAADQTMAALRAGFDRSGRDPGFVFAGLRVRQLTGRGAAERIAAACAAADLVVTSARLETLPADHPGRTVSGCVIWDADMLGKSGAAALRDGRAGPELETALGLTSGRIWAPDPVGPLPLPPMVTFALPQHVLPGARR